jgi:hypothetical protein
MRDPEGVLDPADRRRDDLEGDDDDANAVFSSSESDQMQSDNESVPMHRG